ncbi:IS21 family transposase [Ensifer sp. NPDC090286]|uniref:IS21 family transposase n=1 Tax=Ensifer sp. NPDC090286 TaxID=3363991 RepID=UPI00383A1A4A
MLRLAGSGTSSREIAVILGVARSTVQDNLKRAAMAGLSWPLPGELTDDALEHRLFTRAGVKQGQRRRHEPNWAELSIELKKPGVTLLILWEEYRSVHPDGYGYSRFCELFRGFEQRLSPTMRQEHAAGDKVFVDYSGKKVPIVDRKTGEVREAELFLGVLGASSFTFAEATWTQTLPDWISSHVHMFAFFGGVPRLVVPDNLKSGVSRASFYDPEINRSYGMMASHYGVGVLPARPRRPKDRPRSRTACASPRAAFSVACASRRSSRLPRPMLPLPRCWSASTITSCAASASAANISSTPSSAPRSPACRLRITSSPNGALHELRRIIMSSSGASSIPSRTPSSASRSTSGRQRG